MQTKKRINEDTASKRYKVVKRRKDGNNNQDEIDVHKPITEIPSLKSQFKPNKNKPAKAAKNRYQQETDEMDEVIMDEKFSDYDLEKPIDSPLVCPHPYEGSPRFDDDLN